MDSSSTAKRAIANTTTATPATRNGSMCGVRENSRDLRSAAAASVRARVRSHELPARSSATPPQATTSEMPTSDPISTALLAR